MPSPPVYDCGPASRREQPEALGWEEVEKPGAHPDPAGPFRPLPQPAHRPATCSPCARAGPPTPPRPHGNARPGPAGPASPLLRSPSGPKPTPAGPPAAGPAGGPHSLSAAGDLGGQHQASGASPSHDRLLATGCGAEATQPSAISHSNPGGRETPESPPIAAGGSMLELEASFLEAAGLGSSPQTV